MSAPDLEHYLQELRAEGSLDSEGAFSLDQARALEKLRRYQVERPEWYSLALVGSAVAAEATRIDLQCSPQRFHLAHDGRTFTFEELATLFSSLVVGGSDRRRAPARELATGLNALARLRPKSVRVVSSSLQALVVLTMDPKHLLVRQDPSGGFESYGEVRSSTSVEVEGLRRPLLSSLLAAASGMLPEVAALRQRCGFSPVPIYLHDKLLNPSISLGRPLGALTTPHSGCLPVTLDRPALVRQESSPEEFEAVIALIPGAKSQVTLVLSGVTFELGDLDFPPGVRVVVCSGQLRKDLSQTQLVRDENYDQLLGWIRQAVQALLMEVVGLTAQAVPVELRLSGADMLDGFALAYLKNWQGDLARQILLGVRELRRGHRDVQQLLDWGAHYQGHGLAEEAAHYLNLE